MNNERQGMIVVLFRSKLLEGVGDEYGHAATAMLELARDAPGFVDIKRFRSDDGERLTVVWWADEETLAQWRNDLRHRAIQKVGMERWYQYYNLEVATIIRTSEFAQ